MIELALNWTQKDLQFRWQSEVGGPFLAIPAIVQVLPIEIVCLEGKPAMLQEFPAFIVLTRDGVGKKSIFAGILS
ncbi:hypothetical protein VN24_15190 [Paenibacillus beijingensis]|uniref:Uncharacterized protein n=1 Tax=Paenibacillus beijingensis TaxID=1126833 RepID=A0A0D5NKZ7_9BACL|nr:hypothetical protein VN24_15190 [Paenibacillus beijingensis]